ncbi:MAG: hypothetical protein ACPGR7_10540 [Flavobacteriaceae bacterium]
MTILIPSCSKDDNNIVPESELSEYEIDVIDYFKDVALGFEFGNGIKKGKSSFIAP